MQDSNKPLAYRVLRYMHKTPRKGLIFKRNDRLKVDGFSNTDWAGDVNVRKSTNRYYYFIGGYLVGWKSKKHKVVAQSNAEA